MIYFIDFEDTAYAYWYDRTPKLEKAKKCNSLADLRKNSGNIEEDHYGYDGGQFNFLTEFYNEDFDTIYNTLGWQNAMNQMDGYCNKNKKALEFLEYTKNIKIIPKDGAELDNREMQIAEDYLNYLLELSDDCPVEVVNRESFNVTIETTTSDGEKVRKTFGMFGQNDDAKFNKCLLEFFDNREH